MRVVETLVAWNQRVIGGEPPVSWPADELSGELPIVALTCIDPRLNPHFPNVMGLRADQFIWVRNAGNSISSPTSSTVRSLALACAIKGGREIAIIGHTDCAVRATTVSELIDRLQKLGVSRDKLPDDVAGVFNLFASERQNVIRSAGLVRASPYIGPGMPVHGLLIDVQTGRLEWVVNGYETWTAAPPLPGVTAPMEEPPEAPALPKPARPLVAGMRGKPRIL